MPYPMRLGSGTYDVLLGATYTINMEKITWGLQTGSVLRTQDNNREYRLGNQLKLNSWASYHFNDWLTTSLRAEAGFNQKIKGSG